MNLMRIDDVGSALLMLACLLAVPLLALWLFMRAMLTRLPRKEKARACTRLSESPVFLA